MAPLRRKVQMLAAKAEGTVGTAETLSASDAVDMISNLEFEILTQKTKADRPGGGRAPGHVGVRTARLRFRLGLDAATAAPRVAAVYLAACGLGPTGVTGTYKRDTRPPVIAGSTAKTLTMGFYLDGMLNKIYGAAGDATLHFLSGEPTFIDFDFKGKHVAPSDVAILTPTLVNPTLLRLGNASFALGTGGTTWSPRLSKADLALGNKVEFLEDENASDGSGIACAYVDDQETILAIDPEACLVADKGVYAAWEAGTEYPVAFSAKAGGASCAVSFTLGEFINLKLGARRNLVTWDMGVQDNNEDLTLLFTPAA